MVQNKSWEDMVKNGESGTTSLKKGVLTHSSIDNIDEETESLSLHFTNSNTYQPNAGVSNQDDNEITLIEKFHPGTTEEIPPYHIGKLNDSKPFLDNTDDVSTSLIDHRFSIDMIWSIWSIMKNSQ